MPATRLRCSVIGVALGIVGCGGSSNDAARSSGGYGSNSLSGGGSTIHMGGATGSTVDSGGSSAQATGGTADTNGGASGSGATTSMGGVNGSGGSNSGNAGGAAMGGHLAAGGAAAGGSAFGGTSATGGTATGGVATGITSAVGGGPVGGKSATSAAATSTVNTGGTTSGVSSGIGGASTGGKSTSGGVATGGALTTSTATTDPCSVTNTLSNGTPHCDQSASGSYGSYEWQVWWNQPKGCLTTYTGEGGAFSANWDNTMDLLARVGLVFDGTKTHQEIGVISAEFSETHQGSAGDFSYIGFYGWMVTPTVEYYIVEDSFDALPFSPIAAAKLITFEVDGGSYDVYSARIPGTGEITQVFSVRQGGRRCGRISVSEHFTQWTALGVELGKLQEARLFVEAGGGQGSIDFTVASVAVN